MNGCRRHSPAPNIPALLQASRLQDFPSIALINHSTIANPILPSPPLGHSSSSSHRLSFNLHHIGRLSSLKKTVELSSVASSVCLSNYLKAIRSLDSFEFFAMADAVTSNGVATILANPSPDSSSPISIVLQIVQLEKKASGGRYTSQVTDGMQKIKAGLNLELSKDAESGQLVEKCLVRITDYVVNKIGGNAILVIVKGEVAAPALETEVGAREVQDSKPAGGIELKPKAVNYVDSKSGLNKQVIKSAAQIVHEQRGTASPATQMGSSRRVYPIVSLNPYQGNWTIKVRVTSKGPLRTFKNARGEGNVFNVELTDENGTQIQATMFKEAADKFFDKLQLNKVYFISKGSLRVANKQYATVKNDYEMTLNFNSEVDEVPDDGTPVTLPTVKYNFIKIDELGPHVNARRLVDVIGVVQSVSPLTSIRRKTTNEEIPKREVTIADQSQKTVAITLWNDLAIKEGAMLSDTLNDAPILVVRALRVGDFQGVSLNSTINTAVSINPEIIEAETLRAWYDQGGRSASMVSAGVSLPGGLTQVGSRNSFADRAVLSEVTEPSVGEEKAAYFNVRAYISYIKPDQAMWYLACTACNRKVTEESSSSYWCEGCQKHCGSCNRRYIMLAKMSDSSGEAWISAFNEQAESLLGQSAEDLAMIRNKDGDGKAYEAALRKAMWVPHIYRISVAQTEYMNEKRQRVTVRTVGPVDWAAESRHLLENIAKVR